MTVKLMLSISGHFLTVLADNQQYAGLKVYSKGVLTAGIPGIKTGQCRDSGCHLMGVSRTGETPSGLSPTARRTAASEDLPPG